MVLKNATVSTPMSDIALPVRDYDNHVQHLRELEYPQLKDTTYLDHAGTTLHANSLIDVVARDLKTNLFGNPHSASPSSTLSSIRIDGVRSAFLKYLNADPEHFEIVFTANATAAIKLLVDGLREQSFRFCYHKDAHTSVVGVRELATAGSRCFESDEEVDGWLDHGEMDVNDTLGLFAYPAQSNMTGYRPPLSWCERLRNSNHASHKKMFSLLDAASYLTTGRLDLSDPSKAPDFISLSFYKIFGFADLGALILKKEAGHLLTSRKFFGGGTVDMVVAIGQEWHAMRQHSRHEVLEDGSLPFHTIPAIQHALNVQQQLFGNALQISEHVSSLSATLYKILTNMRHYNDNPIIKVYKEAHATHGDAKTQGPIIAFNVRRADGSWVGKSHFETLAIACNIQMRSGGVCNPGGIATMLELEPWKMRRNYCEGMRCGDDSDIIGGQPTGILRVSLGPMSTKKDVDTFARFVEYFFVEKTYNSPASPDYPETAESKTQITPIGGCPPIMLPHFEGLSQTPEYKAWSVFHDEWCIVQLETLLPLPIPKKVTAALSLALNPRAGTLTISLLKTEERAGSYFSAEFPKQSKRQHRFPTPPKLSESTESQPQSMSVTVDLWDPPPQRKSGVPARNGCIADPYQQSGIAEFFSRLIGIPCTLARYRPGSSSNVTQNCELANCRVELSSKKELKLHYEEHAKAFEDFGRTKGIDVWKSVKQFSFVAKPVEGRPRTRWTKLSFALKTRKRKT